MTVQEKFKQYTQQAAAQIMQMNATAVSECLDKAFALRAELNDEVLLSQVYQLRGRMLGKQGRMDEALAQYHLALHIREAADDKLLVAQTLQGIGVLYQLQSKFTEALDYYHQSETLAGQVGNRDLQIRCWQNASLILHQMGNYARAFAKAEAVAEHYRQVQDQEQLASAVMNLGGMLYDMGEDERSLHYLFEGIRLLEQMGSKIPPIARAYFNVGLIYFNREQNEEALKYFRLATTLQEEINDEYDLVYTYAHLGSLLAKLGQTDEATAVLQKGESICGRIDNAGGQSLIYHHQAKLHAVQNRYAEALALQTTALHLQKQVQLADAIVSSLTNTARYLIQLKRHTEARPHLEEALQLATTMNLKPFLADVYEAYTDLEKASGNFETALTYFEQHVFLQRQILSESSTKNVQHLQIQFETEKKDHQIVLLKKENEEALLKERLRISRDLHDDMGATLSSISVYGEAVKQRIQQNRLPEAENLLNRISEDAREMVSNMSDTVWMLNMQNDRMEKLVERMHNYASNTLTSKNIQLNFICAEEIKQQELTIEQRKNIYLLVKEAINNAAKYAEAEEVSIRFEKEPETLHITIADNGKGFNPKLILQQQDANGLKNMHDRANALQGQLNIQTEPGKGTVVGVIIPKVLTAL